MSREPDPRKRRKSASRDLQRKARRRAREPRRPHSAGVDVEKSAERHRIEMPTGTCFRQGRGVTKTRGRRSPVDRSTVSLRTIRAAAAEAR